MNSPENRCRLVLITPSEVSAEMLVDQLKSALEGGDVASIIVPQYELDEDAYQALLEQVVAVGQAAGAAVVASGDTRIAGRCNVDGIHVIGGFTEVRTALHEFGHKWIIGSGGAENRHAALTLGEEAPDYVFFGRFRQDTHGEPHKRNIELAKWWSEFVEVPCIVMGGNDLQNVKMSAETGADFVALSRAVLAEGVDAKSAVHDANEVLAEFKFEDVES